MSRPADNILGTLPVPKLVWTMSAPIMLSMLMSAIYNLVDSIYVAQVSELDFLALSYAYPVQLMMVAFCAGTGVGFNALFAQRLGAGQREEANRVACHGFLFYGLCWLLFLAFALLAAPLFFRLSTDNAAVAAAGTSYLRICCGLSIGMRPSFSACPPTTRRWRRRGPPICASAAACPSGCVCSSSPSACSRPPATPPAL